MQGAGAPGRDAREGASGCKGPLGRVNKGVIQGTRGPLPLLNPKAKTETLERRGGSWKERMVQLERGIWTFGLAQQSPSVSQGCRGTGETRERRGSQNPGAAGAAGWARSGRQGRRVWPRRVQPANQAPPTKGRIPAATDHAPNKNHALLPGPHKARHCGRGLRPLGAWPPCVPATPPLRVPPPPPHKAGRGRVGGASLPGRGGTRRA